jgi:hypothetical protein
MLKFEIAIDGRTYQNEPPPHPVRPYWCPTLIQWLDIYFDCGAFLNYGRQDKHCRLSNTILCGGSESAADKMFKISIFAAKLIEMIQRIQTVYLFIGAIALVVFNFMALGIDTTPEPDVVVFGKTLLPVLIGSLVVAAFTLLAIFLYKNRVLQSNVSKLSLFLTAVIIGVTAYLLFGNSSTAIEVVKFGVGFPVLALIFQFLGLKGIQADEKLVRSMDRLR